MLFVFPRQDAAECTLEACAPRFQHEDGGLLAHGLKTRLFFLPMKFHSTRSEEPEVGFFEAFANGLAPDGGLYLPGELPALPEAMLDPDSDYPYPKLAADFFAIFDTDHAADEIRELVRSSHRLFETPPNAAPLKHLDERLFVLELFHGPTLAFKDFGLQIVGSLFADQINRTGKPINVLGATSGDTGSAAIHGLANQPGVNAFILYPKGRISPLQERQMTCTGASNIYPIAIEGSFDDAQNIVKDLFGDLDFKADVGLSAVNSINLARVLAQSVYYIHAWRCLPDAVRRDVTFNVPTGNFGNIFAGWLASKMGLPVERFRIATNQNDILYRLFTTGEYAPGGVNPSFAPSMDIQVASNFERFLFYAVGGDAGRVNATMRELKEKGATSIPGFDPDTFTASRTTDEGILRLIREVKENFDYVADPHTACGFEEAGEGETTVVLATAHPAKFPSVIEEAIGEHPVHPALEALKEKEPVNYEVEATEAAMREFILSRRAK